MTSTIANEVGSEETVSQETVWAPPFDCQTEDEVGEVTLTAMAEVAMRARVRAEVNMVAVAVTVVRWKVECVVGVFWVLSNGG